MSEESQAQKRPIIVPQDERFIESHITAAPVNLLNDGSIAIEFLRPNVVLVVDEEGRVRYEGNFVSVARIIMNRETAKRLLADLTQIITLYEEQLQQKED